METDSVRKRTSSLSTFSEIDTSDLAGDLSELPTFDHLKDIVTEDFSIPRNDFINNFNNLNNNDNTKTSTFMKSFQKFLRIPKLSNLNNNSAQQGSQSSGCGSLPPLEAPADVQRVIFPCSVCGLEFRQKSRMKEHVRVRHLRLVVSCHECDKRVFADRMARHWKYRCGGSESTNTM